MARPKPPRAPPCYAPRPVGAIEKRRVASATPALPGAKPFAVSVVPTFLQAAHTGQGERSANLLGFRGEEPRPPAASTEGRRALGAPGPPRLLGVARPMVKSEDQRKVRPVLAHAAHTASSRVTFKPAPVSRGPVALRPPAFQPSARLGAPGLLRLAFTAAPPPVAGTCGPRVVAPTIPVQGDATPAQAAADGQLPELADGRAAVLEPRGCR